MEKLHPVLERLSRGQWLVLDGSVPNELARRGYNPNGPLQNAAAAREAPEVLSAIHRAYLDAGCDVITAFTERTTARALARGGLGMRAAALTHRAIDIALECARSTTRSIAVAASLGPLEDRAERTPSPRSLADEHGEQAARFQSSGCDLVIVGAMPSVEETLAAVAAARRVMPAVWATLCLRARGELPDGTKIEDAARFAVAVGAQAIVLEGANLPELLAALASVASRALAVPLGVRWTGELDARTVAPDKFAHDLGAASARGARLFAGTAACTPDHARALSARLHTAR